MRGVNSTETISWDQSVFMKHCKPFKSFQVGHYTISNNAASANIVSMEQARGHCCPADIIINTSWDTNPASIRCPPNSYTYCVYHRDTDTASPIYFPATTQATPTRVDTLINAHHSGSRINFPPPQSTPVLSQFLPPQPLRWVCPSSSFDGRAEDSVSIR